MTEQQKAASGAAHDVPLPMTFPVFCHGPGWFRVCGYGIRHVDHRRHPALFSERYGYRRVLHIGPHCFAVVKP